MAHFGYNCETGEKAQVHCIYRFVIYWSVCKRKLSVLRKDINQNAVTFRTASSFVEANATTLDIANNLGLRGFFHQDILINLRTFDSRSLIFYAYDYHNNFVQLHIEDGNQVVFTFNSANTIHSVSTVVKGNYLSLATIKIRSYFSTRWISRRLGLTSGQSIQILVDREAESTALHVNTAKSIIEAPLSLMQSYARAPWINKEKGKTILNFVWSTIKRDRLLRILCYGLQKWSNHLDLSDDQKNFIKFSLVELTRITWRRRSVATLVVYGVWVLVATF